MLLVESAESTQPVAIREPHFPVMPAFVKASYSERYCVLLKRLQLESLYSSTTYMMTPAETGRSGVYTCPDPDLAFRKFIASLYGAVVSFQKMQG